MVGFSNVAATQSSKAQTKVNQEIQDQGLKSLSSDFNNFLKLLTTQLQYQDPMEPIESSEFTNQLVQFSSVEQSINMNKKLSQLIDLQSIQKPLLASSYIDKEIESDGSSVAYSGAPVSVRYNLERNASNAFLNIHNESGQVIKSVELNPFSGSREALWDGTTVYGDRAPFGVYNVSISAVDADKQSVDASTSIKGIVHQVDLSGDEPVLVTQNGHVGLGQVKAIRIKDSVVTF